MPKPKEIKYWRSHIRKWEESRLRKSEYCRKEGISPWTLTRWRTYFNKQGKKTGLPLVEVPIDPAVKMSGVNYPAESLRGLIYEKPITVVIDRNYRIELAGDFNSETLKKIIRTVREIGLEAKDFGPQIFPWGGPG